MMLHEIHFTYLLSRASPLKVGIYAPILGCPGLVVPCSPHCGVGEGRLGRGWGPWSCSARALYHLMTAWRGIWSPLHPPAAAEDLGGLRDFRPHPTSLVPQQALEEEFQFLCCQSCQAEAKCPKLLPCLHTLCSGCLEASGLHCSICQVPGPLGAGSPALDNVFFESLQRRLSVYRQIVDAQAVCTRCKEPADFWCFECEQLLCAKCFEAHQWFLKHEARPLAELRSQSVCEFLDSTRKSNSIFCSNPNHRTPMLTR